MPLRSCLKYAGCLLLAAIACLSVRAQDTLSAKYQQMEGKYVSTVNGKVSSFNGKVDKYTEKALDKVIRQEKKMQRKVAKVDSLKAKLLFAYSIDSLQKFKTLIQSKTGKVGRFLTGRYFPYLDTLKQSLGFFNKAKGAMDDAGKMQGQLDASMATVDGMESRLATVDKINEYLKQRQSVLQSQLGGFPGLSGNMASIQKQAAYYRAQIGEYKNVLQDPEKIEKTALGVLEKVPAFQQFVQQHSQLAGIFASPGGFGSGFSGTGLGAGLGGGGSLMGGGLPGGAGLTGGGLPGGALSGGSLPGVGTGPSPVVNGLASRGALQQFIRGQVPSAVPGADMTMPIQQQTDKGGSALDNSLDNLTGRLHGSGEVGNGSASGTGPGSGGNSGSGSGGSSGSGSGSGAGDLPDYTPDGQKLKSFRKRLEYGANLQFGTSTNWMPASANMGLQGGYKLSERSSVGVGLSYAMGLGTGWNHIRFSNQSLGLRTYVKWKPSREGKIFLQGGSEWNYLTSFGGISDLRNFNAWQTSALLGIGKSYKLGKKLSGTVLLLYDFLYDRHVPVTQPLLVRMGYSF